MPEAGDGVREVQVGGWPTLQTHRTATTAAVTARDVFSESPRLADLSHRGPKVQRYTCVRYVMEKDD